MIVRRILIYSLLALGMYYGYGVLFRASSVAPDMRHNASENAAAKDPISTAIKRRAEGERAVEQSATNKADAPKHE